MPLPRPLALSLLLAATALVGGASSASAATTISKVGSVITVTGDGTASHLTTSAYFTVMQLEEEPGGIVNAGTGCMQDGSNAAVCGNFESGDSIVANLGGGDDFYKYATIDVPQTVNGEGGVDTIETGNGKDTVSGGPGNDDLTGGRGDDTLDGGEGDDKVDGWDGSDSVTGGPGKDTLLGDGGTVYAGGNDKIFARDGEVDSVDCGGGADSAQVDTADVVSGCVSVDRPSAGSPGTTTPGTTTPGTDPGTPTPKTSDLSVTSTITKQQTPSALSKGKKITATLTSNGACSAVAAIAVSKSEAKRLKLGTKALTLGTSKAVDLTAAAPGEVKVAVESKFRKKLAKASKVKATVIIACSDGQRTFTGTLDATFKK